MQPLHDDDIATWRWYCIMDADATGWWWRMMPRYYDNTRTSLHGYHALLYCMCTWYYFLLHLRLIQGPRVTGESSIRRWGHRSTGTYLMLLAPLHYVWIFHVFHFWVGFKVPPPPNWQPLTVFCLCQELALISRQTPQTAARTYVLPQQRWFYFVRHVSTHPVTSKSDIIIKKTCWWKMTFRQNPQSYVSFRWSSRLQINK